MSDGRTIWRTKDCLWHEREWIVILVEEFGPAGYAVIDYLEGQAKLQNDGGQVKAGPRAVARATGTDAVTVGHVLSRSVTLGLLQDYRESNGRFICTVAWFSADQGRGMAANRQARRRASDPVDKGDPPPKSRSVTPGHASSRPVTNTVQDSTVKASPNGDAVAAAPPLTAEQRETEEKVAYLCHLMSAEVRTTHGIDAKSREALPVKGWHDACRAMLTRDGLTAERIEAAIRWVCRHHYWRNRIKSMTRLRSEMAQVLAEMDRPSGGRVVPIRGDSELDRRRLEAAQRLMNGGQSA